MKLEIGYNHSFEIRKETFASDCPDTFSVLYLSDLHLTKFSHSIVERIVASIAELDPTIILLGGDYADSQKGLVQFDILLRSISNRQHVFAIAGNHDYYIGIDNIKKIVQRNDVVWLEQKSSAITFKNTTINIDGNFIRTEISSADFSIVALHKPAAIKHVENYYNLALAGHLHGCQVVLWQTDNKLYPGKLFYKCNILKAERRNCRYYVSKGLGDTIPVRYNCKKDLLFIQVIGNNTKRVIQ